VNTLAQTLYQLKERYSDDELAALIAKLRVYTISDQDDSGAWIRKEFPELFYIVSPGGYGAATWTAMMGYIDGIDNHHISNPWIASNIQQNHGPLGAAYPDTAYGMEGDTPSFLNLIPTGLANPEQPSWGGWGGRYEFYIPDITDTDPTGFNGNVPIEPEVRPIWTNAEDTYRPMVAADYGRTVKPMDQEFTNIWVTLWRWREAIQNDFAARMDWTVKSYAEANHPPVPKLNHAQHFTVSSGQYFELDASDSIDPDGDSMAFYWFNYPEAGSLPDQTVTTGPGNIARLAVQAPTVDAEQQLHFILQLSDRGVPSLTRYKRVIVTVKP